MFSQLVPVQNRPGQFRAIIYTFLLASFSTLASPISPLEQLFVYDQDNMISGT